MEKSQFDECVVAACKAANLQRIVVFGSQAVWGTPNDDYPDSVKASAEVDVSTEFHAQDVAADAHEEALDRVEVFYGEGSVWAENRGYYIEAPNIKVAVLPENWEYRLVEYHAETSTGTGTALCLSIEDTCVTKLMRLADNDRKYVTALIDAGLVDTDVVLERLQGNFTTGEGYNRDMLPVARERATAFVESLRGGDAAAEVSPGLFPHSVIEQMQHVQETDSAGSHEETPGVQPGASSEVDAGPEM